MSDESTATEGGIFERVVEIVSKKFEVDKSEINCGTNFVDDLQADSLDSAQLILEFEEAFEISIPDEKAAKITTVGAAVDHIQQRLFPCSVI